MDDVFTAARVMQENTETGAIFTVTGEAPRVVGAIRRMATAHAATLTPPWDFAVTDIPNGARIAVTAPQDGRARLQAIGYLGLLADGDHHRAHHWMMALGHDPH